MILADTHAHLYLDEFNDDRHLVIRRALDEGIRYIFLPNIDQSSIRPMMDLAGEYPGTCFPMMGLHPTSVKEDHDEQLKLVEEWLSKGGFIAVGEIGIDLYWDTTYREEQEDAFRRQLRLAITHALPVAIHTRNSMDVALGIIKEEHREGLSGVFHCFSGTAAQAEEAVDMGFYLGIGGVVTFKNSDLPGIVKSIPIRHLLLETDAPFLAPVPYRGKRNESAFIRLIATKVGEIKNMSREDVASVTTANALKLFNLSDHKSKNA